MTKLNCVLGFFLGKKRKNCCTLLELHQRSDHMEKAMQTNTPVIPTQTLLNGKPYNNSSQTNVQETWKRFGWTPVVPKQ